MAKNSLIDRAIIINENRVEDLNKLIDTFPKPSGSYGYDAWGFNIKGLKPFLTVGKWMHDNFFRVVAHGLENIPKEGRVLIISNHSGQLPFDAMMLGYSLVTNPHAPRAPKGMMEFFVPKLPYISSWFSQWGGIVGDPENCKHLLQNEEAILVFPEGSRGISKSSNKKYQLERFGNGFMRMALDNNTPIIPIGMVGFEESMIRIGQIKPLAKMFKLSVFPILAPILLPTKVIINIGEPMYFKSDGYTPEYLLEEKVNKVKAEINKLIKKGLSQRTSVFEK